jgi:pyridoxamine 5'-phosphate oxidase
MIGDFTLAEDPFALFEHWFSEAAVAEVNDPNAMTLATISADGVPEARIVLLKGQDRDGFVFYTNTMSAKGKALAAHPQAALLFHWKSLRRQVRISGPAAPVSEAEADAYFQSRPRDSRIGAWASQQSSPLASRAVLEQEVQAAARRFADGAVPRPPHWTGYRISPQVIEFWQDREYRLHDRIVFRRAATAADWEKQRLFP